MGEVNPHLVSAYELANHCVPGGIFLLAQRTWSAYAQAKFWFWLSLVSLILLNRQALPSSFWLVEILGFLIAGYHFLLAWLLGLSIRSFRADYEKLLYHLVIPSSYLKNLGQSSLAELLGNSLKRVSESWPDSGVRDRVQALAKFGFSADAKPSSGPRLETVADLERRFYGIPPSMN